MVTKPREDRVAEYVDSPRLDQRMRRGTAISARVHGSIGLYRVHADLKDKEAWGCTCPSEYRPCRHVAALVATYKKRPRTFVELDQKLRKLRGLSPPELAKLVEKIVTEHPDALASLGARGFSRRSRWTSAEYEEEEGPDE
jgi:uncharacterized Zn finger protein